MWFNLLTGSWMTIEEELPQRVRQTIKAANKILTVFFNPKEFARANMLLEVTSFTAAYFVDKVIVASANRRAQQRGDIACRRLKWYCDNS
jgi:intergrase/recombinase